MLNVVNKPFVLSVIKPNVVMMSLVAPKIKPKTPVVVVCTILTC